MARIAWESQLWQFQLVKNKMVFYQQTSFCCYALNTFSGRLMIPKWNWISRRKFHISIFSFFSTGTWVGTNWRRWIVWDFKSSSVYTLSTYGETTWPTCLMQLFMDWRKSSTCKRKKNFFFVYSVIFALFS